MTLLTLQEAAAFLRFKNPRSLYANKTIPRVYAGRLLRFVKEELEEWLKRKRPASNEEWTMRARPPFRIKVRR